MPARMMSSCCISFFLVRSSQHIRRVRRNSRSNSLQFKGCILCSYLLLRRLFGVTVLVVITVHNVTWHKNIIVLPFFIYPQLKKHYSEHHRGFINLWRRCICLQEFATDGLVNIVGGCCGTTPGHIRSGAFFLLTRKLQSFYATEDV